VPKLLYCEKNGKIHTHPDIESAAMKAGKLFRAYPEELIGLPPGSQLFMLPGRTAIGYDPSSGETIGLEGVFAVGAFLAPGYTSTYSPAYLDDIKSRPLPLFSYSAAVSYKSRVYVAAVKVDNDKRHDQRLIDMAKVKDASRGFKKSLGRNRLVPHLERCASSYGCPNAQNFFLSRYECPLPTAPACNARCAGCISYQNTKNICPSQPRIKFVPSPEEIAEIAVYHISHVRSAIVSFGQGCEGEPLTQGGIIEKAIAMIRRRTGKGTINMNTNGSRPEMLKRLIGAGLDSVRISLNSARGMYYARYYRPVGYKFHDVVRSIKLAKNGGAFVSLNYLTMPGFTDSREEFKALKNLLRDTGADMIQWRNLNYDPLRYFDILKVNPPASDMIGIRQEMALLKKQFPNLRHGYFNPHLSIS
jgi:pyruvate-formate lyase-activating enzyme